jgi:origin recognition complex subunit 3
MLNKILESSILRPESPFHLSGKSFKVLMDIFLFYDYSLNGFLKGFKIFMLEHFYCNDFSALCDPDDQFVESQILGYSHEDCEFIRRNFPSFRRLVEEEEDPQARIHLLNDDQYFKKKLGKNLKRVRRYWNRFYCFLEFLLVLLEDLPKNNLGKFMREIYPICVSTDITKVEEFQEILQFLRFSSKEKFLEKIEKVMKTVEKYCKKFPEDAHITRTLENLEVLKNDLITAGMTVRKLEIPAKPTPTTVSKTPSRHEMMENLKKSVQTQAIQIQSEFEERVGECLKHFQECFARYLAPIQKAPPFIEATVFTDVQSVKRQIIGAPRGTLHTALNNPHNYLQCDCCLLRESEQVLSTLPDISIVYKLHLECGKFINLYDWLLAFKTVVEANDDAEDLDEDYIDPQVQ